MTSRLKYPIYREWQLATAKRPDKCSTCRVVFKISEQILRREVEPGPDRLVVEQVHRSCRT
jgi:hypothetical protein